MISVTKDDFSADEIVEKIKQYYTGGVVTFRGVVRGESKGKEIERMTIEVYEEMAMKQLETIREEALEKFDVQEVAVTHRYGDLNVSDNIVFIGVAAAHRADAFQACMYVIDELKTRVPIWKKEYTPDGEVWVEGERHE